MSSPLCTVHKYSVTFDHAKTTGHKREYCYTCGCIRWTLNGKVVRESQAKNVADFDKVPA